MKYISMLKRSCLIALLVISTGAIAQTIPAIGEIPAGDSIIIVYDVKIDIGVTSVSNQANITGTNFSAFNSNDPNTAAPDDPTVTVVDPSVVLPVNFVSVRATKRASNIEVEWKLATEQNIRHYEVEKSNDGRLFSKMATVAATANNGNTATYTTTDVAPNIGINFYRVKAVSSSNATMYSAVVKVNLQKDNAVITLYPNPAKGGQVNIQLTNQPEGEYAIQLINNLGQVVYTRSIDHHGGFATQTIKVGSAVAKGIYQMVISSADAKVTQQVIFE
jgi:hypothetical protein